MYPFCFFVAGINLLARLFLLWRLDCVNVSIVNFRCVIKILYASNNLEHIIAVSRILDQWHSG